MATVSCAGGSEDKAADRLQYDTVVTHISVVDTNYIVRDSLVSYFADDTTQYDSNTWIVKLPSGKHKAIHTLQHPRLDSAATRKYLEQVLWSEFINIPTIEGYHPLLAKQSDIEYLPYLHLFFKGPKGRMLPSHPLMSTYQRLARRYLKPKSIKTLSYTDALRISVIKHQDRNALSALRSYYRNIGDELGSAVYYKIMLSHEGNGDLAEEYYKLLKPYFLRRPELEDAAHITLLRAATCDNDKRAQELCDSLGYSICDYKIELP